VFIHNRDYLRGVALVLQGESLKAASYVTHAASLGAIREKMVTQFVENETPDLYRVETGLIRDKAGNTSRQCDLLVHESTTVPPLSRWDDFVIVHAESARAVLEVKSTLDQANFSQIINIYRSVSTVCNGAPVYVPVYAYALSGVQMNTLAGYIAAEMKANALGCVADATALNVPVSIVIQDRQMIALRPTQRGDGHKSYCCLVDFNEIDKSQVQLADVNGLETGTFLGVYREVLKQRQTGLSSGLLYTWFNSLPVKTAGKLWVEPNGTVHTGNIV
jgi:hypothetical protein